MCNHYALCIVHVFLHILYVKPDRNKKVKGRNILKIQYQRNYVEATVCTLYAAPISRMNLKLGSKTEELVCIGSRWSKNMSFPNIYIYIF